MIRRAVEKDIPKIIDLLKQVCLVHHKGRPDIFKVGTKYSAEELKAIFKDIDENMYKIIAPLLPEVVFLEKRLEELRGLPHLRIHPTNSARQEVTAAGKQYKELLQQYANNIKILQTTLYRQGGEGDDGLLKMLGEFLT